MVWDPLTGDRRAVDIPALFHRWDMVVYHGSVRCVDGDGCWSSCVLEQGWVCPTPGAPCRRTVCGDGVQEGWEQCDQRRRQLCLVGAPLLAFPPLRHAGGADIGLHGLRPAGGGRRQAAVPGPPGPLLRRRRLLPDDQPGARPLRRSTRSRSRSRSSTTRRWAWCASGRRCSTSRGTPTPTCTATACPNFVKLADAYGCLGLRAETPEQLDHVIDQARAHAKGPPLVAVRVRRAATTA